MTAKKTNQEQQKNSIEDLETLEENTKKKMKPTKKILYILFILFLLLIVSLFSISFWYLQSFSNISNQDPNQITNSIKSGLSQNPFIKKDQVNILVLGKDDFGQGREGAVLTDTIILVSAHKSGSITLLPFPRDLWIDPLKTKINALYYYGEKSEDITGQELVSKSVEEISGQNIDHTLILSLKILEDIINVVGGVSVNVETAFVDEKFPRSDVSPDILPVELRYETISFSSGVQQMDGATAIKFIRSRQSQSQEENTDNARSKRQQKIITAIIQKISSKKILLNPSIMGDLYGLYKSEIETSISDEEIISLASSLRGKQVAINSISIPVQTIEDRGLLYNPPIYTFGQWVYLPHDQSWTEIKEYITNNLN